MKRLLLLLVLSAPLLALGGCALGPTYGYSGGDGGYYYGEPAYGHADTVIYGGSSYPGPWFGGSYYGPGWGYGGLGLGVTYSHVHRPHRYHGRPVHPIRTHGHRPSHRPARKHHRPANRPPPVKAVRKAPRAIPRRLPQAQPRQPRAVSRPATARPHQPTRHRVIERKR